MHIILIHKYNNIIIQFAKQLNEYIVLLLSIIDKDVFWYIKYRRLNLNYLSIQYLFIMLYHLVCNKTHIINNRTSTSTNFNC